MKVSISEEIPAFLDFLVNIRGYSEATRKTYETALLQMAEQVGVEQEGETQVWNLMPFRHSIAKLNKKSISLKLSAIRSFVDYLDTRGMKVTLKGDASIKIPKTLPRPLSTNHIKEAIAQADTEEKLLITLLYGLGLRISEVANLKFADLSDEWARVCGKGNKTRDIPVMPELANLLQEYRKMRTEGEFLFENERGKLSENSLRYRLSRAFQRVGIKATPHQLRHSYATDLLNNGARILDVKELLGHSSLVTTEIYTKLSSSHKLESYLKSHPLCKDSHED